MSRDYVFTAWNKPEYDESNVRYICWGIERCPTTDREHWQGFAVFNRTHRIPGAKRILSAGDGCHLEQRRGTRQQAIDYCRKCGNFFDWGKLEMYNQKELLDLSITEIKNIDPLFYVRYHRGIDKYKINESPAWRDLSVIWYWGPAGCGKTRRAIESSTDVYKIDYPYSWWDGYVDQNIILLDDYDDGNILRSALLNILDGYPLRLPTKGGHVYAKWETVYITSNHNPETLVQWCPALKRRVTKIINM